jgi:hypothetical protein
LFKVGDKNKFALNIPKKVAINIVMKLNFNLSSNNIKIIPIIIKL